MEDDDDKDNDDDDDDDDDDGNDDGDDDDEEGDDDDDDDDNDKLMIVMTPRFLYQGRPPFPRYIRGEKATPSFRDMFPKSFPRHVLTPIQRGRPRRTQHFTAHMHPRELHKSNQVRARRT